MEHNNRTGAGLSRELVYLRVHEALSLYGPLPTVEERETPWRSILYEDSHHSTALEGNTLTPSLVKALLDDGQALGNKDLREYLEVVGYACAARWVYAQIREPGDVTAFDLVSVNEILHLHELALAPVFAAPRSDPTGSGVPGELRHLDQRPRSGKSTPPSWVEVPAALATWIESLRDMSPSALVLEDLASAHARFASIQPFGEGNGRVSRLVLNVLLVRLGYPPAIFYTRDRSRYATAMRRAEHGEPWVLAELMARSLTDTLGRFAPAPSSNGQALLPLSDLATPELKTTALRTAIERGRLHAQKGADGKWRSTLAWVQEYVDNKYTRRR